MLREISSVIEVIDRYARRGCSRMPWTVQGNPLWKEGDHEDD